LGVSGHSRGGRITQEEIFPSAKV